MAAFSQSRYGDDTGTAGQSPATASSCIFFVPISAVSNDKWFSISRVINRLVMLQLQLFKVRSSHFFTVSSYYPFSLLNADRVVKGLIEFWFEFFRFAFAYAAKPYKPPCQRSRALGRRFRPFTPSKPETFTVDSSTLDSETLHIFSLFLVITLLLCCYQNADRVVKGLIEFWFESFRFAFAYAAKPYKPPCQRFRPFTPSKSETFTVDSSTLDSETLSGSFRNDTIEEPSGLQRMNKSFPETTFRAISGASGVMYGPLDASDKSNFSAPLARDRRRPRFLHLMRSVTGPVKRTFSKHSMRSGWMQRFFLHPVTQMAWLAKEPKLQSVPSRNCFEWGHLKGSMGAVATCNGLMERPVKIGFMLCFLKSKDGCLSGYMMSRDPDTGLECNKEDHTISCSDQETSSSVGKPLNGVNNKGVESESVPLANLSGRGRKSMRLYELLQMEPWDGQGSLSFLQMGRQGNGSCASCYRLSDNVECITSSNYKDDNSYIRCEDPTTLGEDTGVGLDFDYQSTTTAASISGQKQSTRKSFLGSKIRKIYQKQKSLRKKLFPGSHDWHRDEICVDERKVESSGPIRRCKYGVVDHDAVLRVMTRALESTEEAYMEMVEKALDINPELALMGSCVLVMLMKDQDVFVMNLGYSRVILAQERANDRHPNPALLKDDLKKRNRSRESPVHMELDKISEESPMHNQHGLVSMINKNRDISIL
ncbi:peptidyl-prolyl cis-trans isomerase CYP20-3 [Hibiscus syriacus]|uniref:Peptidyl-prolyl cis-trans isomerase CYP20-3 n=1 Tax=Hibiscus syriacus TaxID=106335 RepID=A0A6A3AGD6_HIBSY|nr:peptidyl-prolyl cis-trans isomerase CYP20-3 [Hibiscus syriacus]